MNQLTTQAGQLFAQLKEQLAIAEQLPEPVLARAATAITHCQDALQKLKEIVMNYSFTQAAEEIDFFKTIKPSFTAELFFYTKIYQLHLRWPVCSALMQREYLVKAMAQVHWFFEENLDFYVYCRTNATDRDEQYFMRGQPTTPVLPLGIYFMPADPFTTGYDLLLAHLQANDRMKEYLESQLANFNHENLAAAKIPLKWTDDIVGLVEFAYALVEKGCCNYGKATLVQITTALGIAFGVDLKNHRRFWVDIGRRKSDNPSFMEKLLQCFKRRLDKPDN